MPRLVPVPPAKDDSLVHRRRDELLLQQLGPPTTVRQRDSQTSPATYGFWAFPFPFFSWFDCVHRYEQCMPKRLRKQVSAFSSKPTGPPPGLSAEAARLWLDRRALSRSAWLAQHGTTVEPLRRFWQRGPFYCHLAPDGSSLGYDRWRLVTAAEFEEAAKRATASALPGKWLYARHHWDGKDVLAITDVDVDDFEIFVPHGLR